MKQHKLLLKAITKAQDHGEPRDPFMRQHPRVPAPMGAILTHFNLIFSIFSIFFLSGLLWLRVPFVPVPQDDFAARPPAVGKTPPAPQLAAGQAWYPWYEWQQPPPAAIARLRRLYKDYLRPEEGGPSPGTTPEAS